MARNRNYSVANIIFLSVVIPRASFKVSALIVPEALFIQNGRDLNWLQLAKIDTIKSQVIKL